MEDMTGKDCLSERQLAKAAVVRVKGVSFNYLQFLWAGLGQIRDQQSKGNFAGSLQLGVQFIDYLPDSLKEQFREEAKKISAIQELIRADALPQLKEIPDLYIRGIYRNKLLQTYSYAALEEYVNGITSALNKLGYMENLKMVKEGDADVDMDWIAEQERRRKLGEKTKRTRKASPVGKID